MNDDDVWCGTREGSLSSHNQGSPKETGLQEIYDGQKEVHHTARNWSVDFIVTRQCDATRLDAQKDIGRIQQEQVYQRLLVLMSLHTISVQWQDASEDQLEGSRARREVCLSLLLLGFSEVTGW